MTLSEILSRIAGGAAVALSGSGGATSGPSTTAPLNPSAPGSFPIANDIKDLIAKLGGVFTKAVDTVTTKIGTAAGTSAAKNATPTILVVGGVLLVAGLAIYYARK